MGRTNDYFIVQIYSANVVDEIFEIRNKYTKILKNLSHK